MGADTKNARAIAHEVEFLRSIKRRERERCRALDVNCDAPLPAKLPTTMTELLALVCDARNDGVVAYRRAILLMTDAD